jgi:adenylate cyclase
MKTIEIEGKFLVLNEDWRAGATTAHMFRQGYLSTGGDNSLRIRIIDGMSARLTVKFKRRGLSREEYEYEIPHAEAIELLSHASGGVIEKTGYTASHGRFVWEDVFGGAHAGLIIAEIEMTGEDNPLRLPAWIGKEVTGDKRYSNRSLATRKLTH